jgi:hypothetical protein
MPTSSCNEIGRDCCSAQVLRNCLVWCVSSAALFPILFDLLLEQGLGPHRVLGPAPPMVRVAAGNIGHLCVCLRAQPEQLRRRRRRRQQMLQSGR